MGFTIHVDDAAVLAALRRLAGVFDDPSEIAKEIARLGENATRKRFKTETAPDGTRWKPSLRAQISGGLTLTDKGHLSGSLSSKSGADFAEWGVNRIYAAIHQFGGTIEIPAQSRQIRHRTNAKGELLRTDLFHGKGLVFAKKRHKRVSVRWAFVRAHDISMPARPYLGISPDDASDIVAVIERRLQGALNAP